MNVLITDRKKSSLISLKASSHDDLILNIYAGNLQSSSIIPSSIRRPIFKTSAISNLENSD